MKRAAKKPIAGKLVVKLSCCAASKVLAVEGIRLSGASLKMFNEFDRRGLSGDERMRAIVAKHRKFA